MATCKECGANLPHGRNYCMAHYSEAMRIYKRKLNKYHQDLAEWNNLSHNEREKKNNVAEEGTVTTFAIAIGIIIGGILWYFASKTYQIDGLIGIAILITSTLFISIPKPIREAVGRCTRGALMAAMYFLFMALFVFMLSLISNLISNHDKIIYLATAIFSIILAIFNELTGNHRSSAAPVMPEEPRP